MIGLFDFGARAGNRFVDMLMHQAGRSCAALRFLQDSIEDVDEKRVETLRAFKDESAEQRRVLTDELHKTFITPLDREDIFNLAHCFDDMVTYALTTLEEMQTLCVAADDHIRQMVALVREEADELERAMQRLMNNPRVASEHANEVHERERCVERTYRAAIKALFARASDPQALPALFYRREVYRHISNMSDRADSAANVIGMVVMKLA